MFKIVLRSSSHYPNQLPLFCLLRLISASADRIGYITNFCSMITPLHELNNSSCSQRSIRHLIMSQEGKGKLKVCWTSRPVTSLGHQGGEEFSKRGQIFRTMSNSFKIRPTHFSFGGKIFLGRLRSPLVSGLWTQSRIKG